jgi:WD40 repeat protein
MASRSVTIFNKGIQLVEVATGKVIRRFMGHSGDVLGLTFTADGATLVSGSEDRTICAWDVASST